jgi:hypothetical protein
MAERPILFSVPMVRAILAGAKTQTRRVLKVPSWACADSLEVEDGLATVEARDDESYDSRGHLLCPYGSPGSDLWVRETWRADDFDAAGTIYAADHPEQVEATRGVVRWRSSIHMPRNRSRITLRVTSVRVERLHAITDADALAEGVAAEGDDGRFSLPGYPRAGFEVLWRLINGAESWEANPWVWVVGFDRAAP